MVIILGGQKTKQKNPENLAPISKTTFLNIPKNYILSVIGQNVKFIIGFLYKAKINIKIKIWFLRYVFFCAHPM